MPSINVSYDQLLDSTRLTELIQDRWTNYPETLPLRFIDRLPSVPADDNEIIGTWTNRPSSADIVMDDQAARVIGGGVLELVTNAVPNIKSGREFGQQMINRLDRLGAQVGTAGDLAAFRNWRGQTANELAIDVRETMNYLACQMMLGSLNYNRLGVQIVADWRVPAALKITPPAPWTDAVNGDPVADVLTLKQNAANTYGVVLDRMTLSTADLLNAVKCAKFQALIPGLVNAPLVAGSFNNRDPRLPQFFSELTQMEVEVEDKLYGVEPTDGSARTYTRVLPAGKVLLTARALDGDRTAWDWANAEVTESKVAGTTAGYFGTFPIGPYGPIGYWTPKTWNLNPPGVVGWCVARGFPRRHNRYAAATLTVA